MKGKAGKRTVSFFAAVLLFVTMSLGALAAIPERPENLYVLDEAGVLSQETEQEIIRKNGNLFDRTGAEIVIVTVDFLDGKEIRDYCYDLFESWEIGSSERNNGLLLVLSVAQEDYYALPGYGIEDFLTGEKLDELLNENLKSDFAAEQYDAGVRKFFDAALEELESYYQENGPENDGYEEWENKVGYSAPPLVSSLLRVAARIIGLVVVVILLVIFLRLLGFGGRGGPGGGSGGSGGFFHGLLLGRAIGRSYRHRPPPPPFGGPPFGGPRPPFGGSRPGGGFTHGGGASRGGFSRGGHTRGGGAGRHR